jgi:hypothetical protein
MTTLILEHVVGVLSGAWSVAAQMAPYLLFGFAVAGLLHVAIPPSWIARHLGGRGAAAPVKAALLGVPLPLCSCSVIPVAVSIRREGAGRGATAAFLMSTPQTGVDSFFVTYGLLGPVFALIRPLVAFVSGAVCGLAIDRMTVGGEDPGPKPANPGDGPRPAWWRRAIRHGFVTLPSDIGTELLVGIAVAGLIGALVPANFLADKLPGGLPGMLVMMVIGIPMYVCSTASVPIALGLMQAGVSPGAALVFLITGPATNAATLGALGRMLGPRAGFVYLACLAGSALAAGWLTDRWLIPSFPSAAPVCHVDPVAWPGHAAAAMLVAVLVGARVRRRRAAAASVCACGKRDAPGG